MMPLMPFISLHLICLITNTLSNRWNWENMFNNVSSGDTINYWENIKTNVRKYILEKVKPIIDINKELGVPYRKDIENEINLIEKKYNESLNGIYIFKYIENKDLRNEVEKIMNEIIK